MFCIYSELVIKPIFPFFDSLKVLDLADTFHDPALQIKRAWLRINRLRRCFKIKFSSVPVYPIRSNEREPIRMIMIIILIVMIP